MTRPSTIIVEFFGVPRMRAGRADLRVSARTIAEALAVVAHECPGLSDLVQEGRLAKPYLLSINGRRFQANLDQALSNNDQLLLLSADAGG